MNTDKLLGMLLEAIDYSFLQINGTYHDALTHPVIDKVQYIKEQLKIIKKKEVDLDKEIKNAINKYYNECEKKLQEMDDNDTDMSFMQLDKFAKYFFELGMQVSNKEQKKENI